MAMLPEGYIYLGTDSGKIYRSVDVMTSVNAKDNILPSTIRLQQNYPNPFNPSTTIAYSVPQKSFVTLKVYDILGKEITTLVNSDKSPGNYQVEFHGDNLSNGIYIYEMQLGKMLLTRKMILLK